MREFKTIRLWQATWASCKWLRKTTCTYKSRKALVGGFKHEFYFPYMGCHPSHWRTPSFFQDGYSRQFCSFSSIRGLDIPVVVPAYLAISPYVPNMFSTFSPRFLLTAMDAVFLAINRFNTSIYWDFHWIERLSNGFKISLSHSWEESPIQISHCRIILVQAGPIASCCLGVVTCFFLNPQNFWCLHPLCQVFFLWGLGSHQTSSITINTDLYSAGYMQVFGSFNPFLNCWPSQVHFAIGVVAPEPWPKTFLASATGSAMKYPINQRRLHHPLWGMFIIGCSTLFNFWWWFGKPSLMALVKWSVRSSRWLCLGKEFPDILRLHFFLVRFTQGIFRNEWSISSLVIIIPATHPFRTFSTSRGFSGHSTYSKTWQRPLAPVIHQQWSLLPNRCWHMFTSPWCHGWCDASMLLFWNRQIYPLVMTNIAMEAMAHWNRWFSQL